VGTLDSVDIAPEDARQAFTAQQHDCVC
jgi:hypothetical protein